MDGSAADVLRERTVENGPELLTQRARLGVLHHADDLVGDAIAVATRRPIGFSFPKKPLREELIDDGDLGRRRGFVARSRVRRRAAMPMVSK